MPGIVGLASVGVLRVRNIQQAVIVASAARGSVAPPLYSLTRASGLWGENGRPLGAGFAAEKPNCRGLGGPADVDSLQRGLPRNFLGQEHLSAPRHQSGSATNEGALRKVTTRAASTLKGQ